jgi:metal-responsive CopG/Arc/MetJ family transcriptional regulator
MKSERIPLNVILPAELVKKIDQRAESELLSRAAWIRRALATAVRSEKDTVAA